MAQVSSFEIEHPAPPKSFEVTLTKCMSEGHGPDRKTVQAAYFNTMNTILGAGTMAVPAAMSSGGLLGYELIVLGVVSASVISLRWLIAVTHILPPETPRNYDGIAKQFLGSAAAAAISGAFILGGFSLNTSSMLLITKSLTPLLATPPLCMVEEEKSNIPVLWGIGLLVIFPVCCLRKIEKLKKASVIGIAALAYASLYVLVSGTCHIRRDGVAKDIDYTVVADTPIFACMAMTVSSFSCHLTTIKTYETLGPNRTQDMMMRICLVSLVVAAVFYQIVGVTAYLQFGGDVSGNVLNNVAKADPGNPAMMLANCGLALCLIFSVPITLWALRDTLIQIFRSLVPSARARHARDAEMPVSTEPSRTEWIIATFSIMVTVLMIATLVPSIKTIMSIGGSVGGAFIVFIYPAAFHLAAVKQVSRERLFTRENAAEIAMICIGVGAGLVCLSVGVKNALTPPPASQTDPADPCHGLYKFR